MIPRLLLLLLLAVLGVCSGQEECYDDGSEFCIDQDDILSADLLPGSFLLMEYEQPSNFSRTADVVDEAVIDGTFVKALDEMDYHRKRMNEYLCHGYMAEEIFREVGSIRVKRRNEMYSQNVLSDFLGDENVTVQDKLLSDEGSSKYKNWLHKTTTLDDVYRHYAPEPPMPQSNDKVFEKKHQVYEDPEDGAGEIAEFEGELTGYAMPVPLGKMGKPPRGDNVISGTNYGFESYGPPPSHHHDFAPQIHEQHIYLPSHHEDDEEEYHHAPVYHGKGKGHELSIKDFFEIALTALAFLAFGLFVIQLLMNITNPMMTTTTPMSTVPDIDQRYRRSSDPMIYPPTSSPLLGSGGNEELNELAQRVLRSIEAVLVAQTDHGNCLRRLLCEDNRHSRDTEDGRKIWIPVWSLGMSWSSSRAALSEGGNPWSAMLESLKAAVLGLGRADCAALYPDCRLWRERVKRRRRRRRKRRR